MAVKKTTAASKVKETAETVTAETTVTTEATAEEAKTEAAETPVTEEANTVTVTVVRTFKDKRTGELHKKGSTIEVTAERLAEINSVKTFAK